MPNDVARTAFRATFVNPNDVEVNQFHGRHERAFHSNWYQRLKESMSHHQGNLVPVLLLAKESGGYDLVYGRLRMQAARELGLSLLALAIERPINEAISAMVADWSGGLPWSVYERGISYQSMVKAELLGSKRLMMQSLGGTPAEVNAALDMANLPAKLLAAFPDPREIRLNWSRRLNAMQKRDPDRLLYAIRTIPPSSTFAGARDVYEALNAACGGSLDLRLGT